MKKFTKVMLILAAVLLAVGIGFSVGGTAMGATSESVNLLYTLPKKALSGFTNGNFMDLKNIIDDDNDVAEGETDGNTRVYDVAMAKEIEIELKYDDLRIEEHDGDTFRIEVTNDKSGNVKVKSDGDELVIKDSRKKKNQIVKLFYPKDTVFDSLSISVDAGSVSMNGAVVSDELKVSMGAGDFQSKGSIKTDKCELEVGAGDLSLEGLDAQEIDGQCGVGSMYLKVAGAETDYNYELECGIGEIDLGSESYEGLGKGLDLDNPGAEREMELECGIGEIKVAFEK